MALEIRHKLKKKHGKIPFRRFRSGGYDHFNIQLFVEGDKEELDRLDIVEYQLHSTFPKPLRRVRDRKRSFPLNIWTWGEFDIYVTFHFKDGSVRESVYSLEYSSELPSDDDAYIDVSPSTLQG